jgi:internalin A
MNVNLNVKKVVNQTIGENITINNHAAPEETKPQAAETPVMAQPTEKFVELAVAERQGVFVSYAHEDAPWLKQFRTMLAPLVRNASVPIWYDGDIAPGDSWRAKIDTAMKSAKVAVLMVSPDFLASSFIMDVELPYLVEAAQKGELKLTWLMLRKCITKGTALREFQALHDTGHPFNAMTEPERDQAWVMIAEKIQNLLTR